MTKACRFFLRIGPPAERLWAVDPTGVVASRLVRLSDVPTWTPIEIFDEARHYRVEESRGAEAVAQR